MIARQPLEELVVRFTEAFNRDDLEEVLSLMSEDAIYDEFDGRRRRGRSEIRAAFEPQFRGDFGRVRFHAEDVFADADSGKALIRWRCTLENGPVDGSWRGLDIVHVDAGRITHKLTYAKAEKPLLEA